MRLKTALLLALALALVLAGPARAAAPVWPKPLRYTAALRYDSRAQSLTGRERIHFRNTAPTTLRSVWLRVWPNGYGSCSRRWARVWAVAGGRIDRSATACTALQVHLRRPLAPGTSGSIGLRLEVQLPPRADRFGQDDAIAYFGNALPLLDVQTAAGPDLDPYTDIGDPFFSLSSSWSVTLNMPSPLTAATTGSVRGRRLIGHGMKRLRITAAHARDFAIVAGPLTVETTRTANGVRLARYRRPWDSRAGARRTLAVARYAVERFSARYGDPGEREIDLLPVSSSLGSFGSGMEYPGLVLTSDEPRLVAHELAHQWWYGLVGDDQWRSPWLDESFAEYASRQLPAGVVGEDDLTCDPENPVAPFGEGPLTASMGHWGAAGGDAYYVTVYLGGTCALRSLERDLGPDAMRAFLRGYADAHRFGVTTTTDFVAALRAAAPAGYDVDAFLRRARIEVP